ncbi:MAG: substrate-binding domain-containing protein [Propionibacteriaceae bacterium]|nr:substrate-binding domain-containing protein [Propionibacteriaceae bacterium]
MAEGPQFAQERRRQILDEVRVYGSVHVNDLVERLGVSAVTIRRDITSLARQGLVTRVHGGAVARRSERTTTPVAPTAKKRALGIVTPSMDYYWPQVVNGVQAAVNAYRGQLVLRSSSYSLEDDRVQMQRLLDQGRVDGLLVAPMPLMRASNEVLGWLDALDVPVVLMERTAPPDFFPSRLEWVATDQLQSAELAVRHLASQGHRKVGLLTSLGTPHHAAAREGWSRACRTLGLDMDDVVCEDTPSFSTADRDLLLDGIIERCLSTGTTAVIVHADREAIALLQRCQDRGLSIPQDLAIVAHDDEIASLSSPALTAIRPAKHQIGYEAASLLFRRLVDPDLALHRLALCSELVVRGTSGPHREGG